MPFTVESRWDFSGWIRVLQSGRLCLDSAADDSDGPGWELNTSSSSALSPTGHQTNEFPSLCDCVSLVVSGFTWSGCCAGGGAGTEASRSDGSSDSAHPASAPWTESAAPAPDTSCSNWRWGRTWSSASVNIQRRPERSLYRDLSRILWKRQTFFFFISFKTKARILRNPPEWKAYLLPQRPPAPPSSLPSTKKEMNSRFYF